VFGTHCVRNTYVWNTEHNCVPNTLCSEHLCSEHKCVPNTSCVFCVPNTVFCVPNTYILCSEPMCPEHKVFGTHGFRTRLCSVFRTHCVPNTCVWNTNVFCVLVFRTQNTMCSFGVCFRVKKALFLVKSCRYYQFLFCFYFLSIWQPSIYIDINLKKQFRYITKNHNS